MQTDFDDLRFLNGSENEELKYYLEDKVDSDYANVWVRVPYLGASENNTIYMYYKNYKFLTSLFSTISYRSYFIHYRKLRIRFLKNRISSFSYGFPVLSDIWSNPERLNNSDKFFLRSCICIQYRFLRDFDEVST